MLDRSQWLVCHVAGMALLLFADSGKAAAQIALNQPICYMVTRSGQVHNLSAVCQDPVSQEAFPLRFSGLGLQVISQETPPQLLLNGVVTNISQAPVAIAKISYQVCLGDQVLGSSTAAIVTSRYGLRPGESRRFNQVLDLSSLSRIERPLLSKLRVKVINVSH